MHAPLNRCSKYQPLFLAVALLQFGAMAHAEMPEAFAKAVIDADHL